jgi:8-oxo-dGTP diphosphatase
MVSDTGVVRRDGSRWFERMARFFRRHPWLGLTLLRGMRLVQPRFTVGVVGALLDASGEHVLLVEHVFHAQYPWGLPGGWINRGEDPAQAVEREFCEETGLRVRAARPLLVQRTPDLRGHLDMIFLCIPDGEQPAIRLSNELLGYRWTPLDDLPPMVAFQRQVIEGLRDRLP